MGKGSTAQTHNQQPPVQTYWKGTINQGKDSTMKTSTLRLVFLWLFCGLLGCNCRKKLDALVDQVDCLHEAGKIVWMDDEAACLE